MFCADDSFVSVCAAAVPARPTPPCLRRASRSSISLCAAQGTLAG